MKRKQNPYLKAPSGGPLEQHALMGYLDKVEEGEMDSRIAGSKILPQPSRII
jgi:dihydroorotase